MGTKANRRTFLAGIAATTGAALIARPSTILRPSIDREALLATFCDTAPFDARYPLKDPFTIGRWTYGTNARIAVRAELPGCIDDGTPKPRAPIDRVYENIRSEMELRPYEPPPIEDWIASNSGSICPRCNNRRVPVPVVLDEYYTADDFDPDTLTIQDRNCDWCFDTTKGKQRKRFPDTIDIDGYTFTGSYVLKALTIPGVRIGVKPLPTDPFRDLPATGVMQFEGDGFQGLLMGCLDERR